MIPVRLKLRNFMCYRDNVPELDFNGIHLACLSGDNGNGKSALIDAMTWALWGKARAASDDDLIHSTRTEMEVEFDFTVEKQLYRILRKRTRPKRRGSPGQPSLELQISTGNGFRPLTGNSISQTQQKIIDILHMDYDTFINSAYLRQGHADEFTRQVPSRRKEVLGNILGLAVYEELEERAKEMVRRREADTSQLESIIKSLSDEIDRKPEYEEQLVEAQESLSRLDSITREKESARNELRKKKEKLESRQVQLEELERRIDNSTRDLRRWGEQADRLRTRIKEYEGLINQSEAIEEGYAEFRKTREINERLEQDFRKSVNLERQKNQLEKRIKEAQHSLTTEHTVIQKEIGAAEEKLEKLPDFKKQLDEIRSKISGLSEQEAGLREREKEVRELANRVSYLEAERAQLERQISEIDEKLNLISSHGESHGEIKCPLCETELTREGMDLITGKYTAEKQEKGALLTSASSDLENRRIELKSLQEEKTDLEERFGSERTTFQSRVGILSKEIADIEEEGRRITELRGNLDGIEQRLVKKDFAIAEQQALAEVEKELTELDYDATGHERIRKQLAEKEPFADDKRRLDEAVKCIEQEREAESRAEEAVQSLRDSLKDDGLKKETITSELTQLPQVLTELSGAEAEYQDFSGQSSQAREKIGSIKSEIQRCIQLETTRKEKEETLAGTTRETNIYRELAKAFGKTGIQALLIETALPEIESEANLLLGRMTDNRMHVKFETQQETKSGTVRETLAINIADELGTRNYEMFSGGEAFRIDFAIRIALSRLLAKRAGAPLPTLIIDEGFGTQDSTGMEKLKEVINSIQEDFEKVLVITHMDELKDAFPVRIDVTKGAEGSTITIN